MEGGKVISQDFLRVARDRPAEFDYGYWIDVHYVLFRDWAAEYRSQTVEVHHFGR